MNLKTTLRYNTKLLPQKTYKIITDIEALKQFYLVRLPGKKKWRVRNFEHFAKMIDPVEFGRGLSMNLLSVYQHKDARIRPGGKVKDPHHHQWSENDENILPPIIAYRKRANFFGCRIKDVECLLIESVSVEFKNGSGIPDSNYSALLRVCHRPTKCNFWHFELKTFLRNSAGEEFELNTCANISNKKKERLMTIIGEAFQDKISEFLVHSSDCHSQYLPKRFYRKG